MLLTSVHWGFPHQVKAGLGESELKQDQPGWKDSGLVQVRCNGNVTLLIGEGRNCQLSNDDLNTFQEREITLKEWKGILPFQEL